MWNKIHGRVAWLLDTNTISKVWFWKSMANLHLVLSVHSCSSSSNCVFKLIRRSGGMFKPVLPCRMFSMSNPRSATTVVLGSRRTNKLVTWSKCQLLVQNPATPQRRQEKNDPIWSDTCEELKGVVFLWYNINETMLQPAHQGLKAFPSETLQLM